MSAQRAWYAIYTRARHEKKVKDQILNKGIEAYLPVREVLHQWSDRTKWVEEPLFSCYCFVHADTRERYEAVQSYGAVRILGFNGEAAIVRDVEIENIRRILKEIPDLEACHALKVGDFVRIRRGNLAGLEGYLEETRGANRFVVHIPSIQQAVRFNIALADVEKI